MHFIEKISAIWQKQYVSNDGGYFEDTFLNVYFKLQVFFVYRTNPENFYTVSIVLHILGQQKNDVRI